MNITAMVDAEKKVWVAPVLTRLEVKETAGKASCSTGDGQYPQFGPQCDHS